MSAFVLDCSVAISWLFEDEATSDTDALLERLQEERAIVPNLWRLEIGNVLSQAERKSRIPSSELARFLDLISRLPIDVDAETDSRALHDILALARAEILTTYDAAYLELAMRRGIPLATHDRALIRAADSVAVRCLPA